MLTLWSRRQGARDPPAAGPQAPRAHRGPTGRLPPWCAPFSLMQHEPPADDCSTPGSAGIADEHGVLDEGEVSARAPLADPTLEEALTPPPSASRAEGVLSGRGDPPAGGWAQGAHWPSGAFLRWLPPRTKRFVDVTLVPPRQCIMRSPALHPGPSSLSSSFRRATADLDRCTLGRGRTTRAGGRQGRAARPCQRDRVRHQGRGRCIRRPPAAADPFADPPCFPAPSRRRHLLADLRPTLAAAPRGRALRLHGAVGGVDDRRHPAGAPPGVLRRVRQERQPRFQYVPCAHRPRVERPEG